MPAYPASVTDRPRIVITVAAPAGRRDPVLAERKNRLYAEAIVRHGGEPVVLDVTTSPADRAAAFGSMDGLLLSGGPTSTGPLREGGERLGRRRGRPRSSGGRLGARSNATSALGICRGSQLLNVLHGGTSSSTSTATRVELWPGTREAPSAPGRARTRLARILFPTNVRGGVLSVNTYHHQAVRSADLADGLVASAWSASSAGELVEGLESEAGSGRFVIGVQCHPERTESTPDAFDRLWRVFVDACRGSVATRQSRPRSLVR
jgi:putative glutamine amidotransferase